MVKQKSWEEVKMQTLVKRLDFETTDQYFGYCATSYHNGQFRQCRELFREMPRKYRHELIDYLKDNWADDDMHNFFVKLF